MHCEEVQWVVLVLFGCKQSISTVWTAVFECAIGGPMSSIETVDVGNAVKMMILGTGYFFVSLSESRSYLRI